jgi:hypothetical protein
MEPDRAKVKKEKENDGQFNTRSEQGCEKANVKT